MGGDMIKHETITGTVIYCDECGERGPEAAYEDPSDVIDSAQHSGWTQDDRDRDLCKECSKPKPKFKRKK
jgi:hypothetical protein